MTNRRTSVAVLLEGLATLALLLACFELAGNWFDAHVAFFGETAVVEPSHVREYHRWLVAGGIALAVVVACGVVRRSRRMVAAIVLGTVFAVSSVLFHVALDRPEPPPQHPTGNPNACYSGSNDCPGG
jgi:hypothetical protein